MIYQFVDCVFNGQTIQHGTTSYVQVHGYYFCMKCTCYMGKVKCTATASFQVNPNEFALYYHICNNLDQCKNITHDPMIKRCK